jgi:hypothetical protein
MELVQAEVSNDFVLIVIVDSEHLAGELSTIMCSHLPEVGGELVIVCSSVDTELLKSEAVGENPWDLKDIAEDLLVSHLPIKVIVGKSRDRIW